MLVYPLCQTKYDKASQEYYEETVSIPVTNNTGGTPPSVDISGVLRVTVFTRGETPVPLAERLVFVEPSRKIALSVSPTPHHVSPGSLVTLTLTAKDCLTGIPVKGALIGLAVSDATTLDLVPLRKRVPRLPAMVYLEDEIGSEFVSSAATMESAQALDLLLGTQGWRRFLFHKVMTNKVSLEGSTDIDLRHQRVCGLAPRQAELHDIRRAFRVRAAVAPMAMKAMAMPMHAVAMAHVAPPKAPVVAVVVEDKFDEVDGDDSSVGVATIEFTRQYAYFRKKDADPTLTRSDFTKTLLFTDGLETNSDGQATVTFQTSDLISRFRVVADVDDRFGAFGSSDTVELRNDIPFSLAAKMPLDLCKGDTLQLPIELMSNATEPMTVSNLDVSFGSSHLKILSSSGFAGLWQLVPNSRRRVYVSVEVAGPVTNSASMTISAQAKSSSGQVLFDSTTQTTCIHEKGFPAVVARHGGFLEPSNSLSFDVTIPPEVSIDSVDGCFSVMPTSVSSIASALEALIKQPTGCFGTKKSLDSHFKQCLSMFFMHIS